MQEELPTRERWPTTTSIGLMLSQYPPSRGEELILARKRESGKLCLIAGGMEKSDISIEEAALRELFEEAGIVKNR